MASQSGESKAKSWAYSFAVIAINGPSDRVTRRI